MSVCAVKIETKKARDRLFKELDEVGSMAIQRPTARQKNRSSKKESASKMRLPVVSLFSGCGGLDFGFVGGFEFLGTYYEKTHFDIVWANEINTAACKTYRKNIGDHIVEGDIWDALPNAPENADVVIGGFPCQDISVNGKGAGVDGKRSGLYRAMVEAVSPVFAPRYSLRKT